MTGRRQFFSKIKTHQEKKTKLMDMYQRKIFFYLPCLFASVPKKKQSK